MGLPEDKLIKFTDDLAFHPSMGPVKDLWDQGQMAIIHGIGYETLPVPTSGPWISGTPVSRTRWGPKAGWAASSATWIPPAKTC